MTKSRVSDAEIEGLLLCDYARSRRRFWARWWSCSWLLGDDAGTIWTERWCS